MLDWRWMPMEFCIEDDASEMGPAGFSWQLSAELVPKLATLGTIL